MELPVDSHMAFLSSTLLWLWGLAMGAQYLPSLSPMFITLSPTEALAGLS